jgi:hypothetical protein
MKSAAKSSQPSRGWRSLRVEDFAKLFGTAASEIPSECLRLINENDFRYRDLEGTERDKAILSVLKRIASKELTVAGDGGAKGRWEKGWGENLSALESGGGNLRSLNPRYIRPNPTLRLNQNYVTSSDPEFELNWYGIFSRWLFLKYLSKVDVIYEFGCGSGINIAALATLFPKKKIVGLDWAVSSKQIIEKLAEKYGWNVEGRVFDFFHPAKTLRLPQNSAVLTVGALEQTGTRYEPFLKYLIDSSPAICVNIEPICEWYDPENLIDHLAIMFHKRRGYWENFPRFLHELESKNKVEILKTKRSFFGSEFIEGYSQTIWRPLDNGRGEGA